MKHHGVIFKASDGTYLRSHLVREGLAWKVYNVKPGLPDTTCHNVSYEVRANPAALKKYCQDTKPWSWPSNDCAKWARGALQAVGVQKLEYSSVPTPSRMPRFHPRKKDVQKLWARVTRQARGRHGPKAIEGELESRTWSPERPQRAEKQNLPMTPVKKSQGDHTNLQAQPTLLTDLRQYSRVPVNTLFAKADGILR